jgi:hypothetical protein
MIQYTRSSPFSLSSSKIFQPSSLVNQDILSFKNLSSVLFNLNQENRPFGNDFSNSNSNLDFTFSDVVMIIKLSKVISEEDNYGIGDYLQSNVVFY